MIDVKISGDLEALTQHVLDSAKETAAAVIKGARVRADEIEEKARKRSQEREQELVDAGMISVKQARKQIISQTKLRLKEDLLATKAKILDRVTAEIREHFQMHSKDEKAHFDLLLRLAKEALHGREPGRVLLYLSGEDADRYGEKIKRTLSADLGGEIEIQPAKIRGGLIVELPEEHLQIDTSFDELLREIIPIINNMVEKEIFCSRDEREEHIDGQ